MKRYPLPLYVSSVIFASLLAFSLAACSPAQAQSQWQPGWVPCDANGNPLTGGMVDDQGYELMGGSLTGSASGSQSMSSTVRNYYYSTPYSFLQPSGSSGTVTQPYDPTADSSFSGIGVSSYNGQFVDDSDPNTSINSTISGQSRTSLFAYFLWQPTCDPDNPPSTPTPPPPPTATFLLRTSLTAGYANYYNHQQYDSSPPPSGGMTAQAAVKDDVFGESAQVVAPAPPYAYSYGDYNALQTMTAGGPHLVTSSVQMVSGKGVYTITLSGSGSAQAVNSLNGTQFVGAASAGTSLDGDAKPFNIQLVQPNPNTDPTLGDGTNQFVYSADTPDGYLYIPGAIQVVGGTHADAQMLLDNNLVDLKIETSPIPNTFVHQWAISGNTIYVNTPQNTDNPYPGYQFNHWIFKGLPSSNSSFGNHNVNLYLQGAVLQTAKIQTFFSGNASNWPSSDGVTPNWFNYYHRVAPFPMAYDPTLSTNGYLGMCTMGYVFNHDTKEYTIVGSVLTAGAGAAQSLSVPVFEIGPSGLIQVAGTVKTKGIISYLFVNGHEAGHQAAYNQSVEVPYIDGTPPAGVTDDDGDSISDTWELAHHLDPEDPDTAKFYTQTGGPDDGKGDRESLASMKGIGRVVKYANMWQLDWADLGIQYGKRPAYVPFEYDPLETFQAPSNSLSSNVLTDWP